MKKVLLFAVVVCFSLSGFVVAEQHEQHEQDGQDESNKANKIFDQLFEAEIARSPIMLSYLGRDKDKGKWDDISEAFTKKTHAFNKKQLKKLQSIDVSQLDDATRVSYKLYEKKLLEEIEDYQWRHHSYPVNQMYGTHSHIPSMLINIHQIKDNDDAVDYISRLKGVPRVIDQLIDNLEIRKGKNIIPPKFVFPHVIRDSENVISGYPFDKGEDSTLMADFKKKVQALELSDKQKQKLLNKAEKALVKKVGPSYSTLIEYLQGLEKFATTKDGVWKFKDGDAFYQVRLNRRTTTDLSPEAIHQIGLDEVDRIHNEMRELMEQVGFKGDLEAFFKFMRTDKQFYYPDSDEGREKYLEEARALIDTMKSHMDEIFLTKPKADIIVKAVEPFREKSAGKAFYQRPAEDGSRPGTYYANLYNMENMPIYQMEALAYHEGIPGHHMQISIAQEIENFPKFRKFGSYTAYIEGWGLYSEYVPKEFGFYQDPYSDFGRLAMELWRACRLVVDTGIHSKKWTREQAIEYLVKNTPNSEDDSIKAIERYIVMPGQATAYKIGMMKILELRSKAQTALGERFDIRMFHDVILKNGPVPLDVLEAFVDQWIADMSSPA